MYFLIDINLMTINLMIVILVRGKFFTNFKTDYL